MKIIAKDGCSAACKLVRREGLPLHLTEILEVAQSEVKDLEHTCNAYSNAFEDRMKTEC